MSCFYTCMISSFWLPFNQNHPREVWPPHTGGRRGAHKLAGQIWGRGGGVVLLYRSYLRNLPKATGSKANCYLLNLLRRFNRAHRVARSWKNKGWTHSPCSTSAVTRDFDGHWNTNDRTNLVDVIGRGERVEGKRVKRLFGYKNNSGFGDMHPDTKRYI